MDDAVKNVVKDLESKRTLSSDYPSAERIEKGLIPVYDANNVSDCASSTFRKLLLEELDINAAAADRVEDEEELWFLASLLDGNVFYSWSQAFCCLSTYSYVSSS